jgi:hypothetical protein
MSRWAAGVKLKGGTQWAVAMADRTCGKCGHVFRAPSYLRSHERRKTSCALVLGAEDLEHLYGKMTLMDPDLESRQCRFCRRVFASGAGMRKHVTKSCEIATSLNGMERLYEHTVRQQENQISQLTALVHAQATQVRQLLAERAAPHPGVTIQDSNVHIDNSQHITINVFGQERDDHITPEKLKEIMAEGSPAPEEFFVRATMLIYSPDHPENLTCYIPKKPARGAMVHTTLADGSQGWEVLPISLVLPPMAKRSLDMIFARQPCEDADANAFAPLMRSLADNEARLQRGELLHPILVRNRELLDRVLKTVMP